MPYSLSTPGLSLWSIPTMFVMAFLPHTFAFTLMNKAIGWNNVDPRGNLERLRSMPEHKEVYQKVIKLEGAHSNGYEIFPLWASAVLAANYAGLDTKLINAVSAAFISLRLLYIYAYISQKTNASGDFRTLVYFAGLSAPLFLLIKAGAHLAN